MEQYISKDALFKKIKEIMNEQQEICKADVALGKKPNPKNIEVIYQFQQFIKSLNTLEVKEVDLNEEIKSYFKGFGKFASVGIDDCIDIAKHFFELGMRASNPITAADRGTAEEIIISLKRVEEDYRIDLTREIEWLRNKVKKGD